MTKRLWLISIAFLSLLLSCKQESPFSTSTDTESLFTKTIHYKVKVNGSVSTRASLNEHTQYVFEAGDRLFVSHIESGNTVLYGVLSLMSGAGSTTAIFEGDLACLEEFDVQSSTPIDVTLVSSLDRLHSFAEGKITGTTYPDNEYASSLAEAVQKFSHFTCSTTFGATIFTLSQNTSFLIFNIKLKPSEAPAGTPVTLTISNGTTPILSTTVQAETYNTITRTYFVIGIEGDETTLSNAKLSLSWTNAQTPYSKEFDDLVDGTLSANHYYTVVRSTLTFDGFRIKAIEDGTHISFKYTDGSVQYSPNYGEAWYTLPNSGIDLDANEEICLEGTRSNCSNTDRTPLFTANKTCYIAGNIMSLLSYSTVLPDDAFYRIFSRTDGNKDHTGNDYKVTWININPDDPLKLPVTTLSARCYMEMFRLCTSLTHAPDLPAETLATNCYNGMFRSCNNLVHLRCYINVHDGSANHEKANYDRNAMKSNLDKWLDGVPSSNATILCHPDMVEYWDHARQNVTDWYSDYTFTSIGRYWTVNEWTTYPN